MFTGIIRHQGKIITCDKQGDWRITIDTDIPASDLKIGDSIACNGCCLTIVAIDVAENNSRLSFMLSAETLSCTAPRWEVGEILNLERAMRLGDSLGGHLVTGHVDGLAKIISITKINDSHIIKLAAPSALAKFIAEKGSVTLDGVSLTVNNVEGNNVEESNFSVNIINHTWQVTVFHKCKIGDTLNLEIDLIARYAARLLECK